MTLRSSINCQTSRRPAIRGGVSYTDNTYLSLRLMPTPRRPAIRSWPKPAYSPLTTPINPIPRYKDDLAHL